MSESCQANTFQSSQDFVRALKSPSDPPVVGGPSKIQIAQEAWNNPLLYVPSKSEVIADWILTKFLKDKAKEIPQNSIFDVRYWQLIISLTDSPVKIPDSRPAKAWLTPLLHRIPLGSITMAFLASFNGIDATQKDDLSNVFSSCLVIIWPIAVQRMTTETLQECFGALLSALSSGATSDGIAKIGRTVSTSYRTSLINSSNKKKLHQSFILFHLKGWIKSLEVAYDSSIKSCVLDAGVETLFNLDILRQSHDSRNENPLVERLRNHLAEDRDLVLKIIPALFACYINAIKKNRGALFSQSSRSQPGAALRELHDAGLHFFVSMFALVNNSHQDHHAWKTRLALLLTVDRENIFDHKQAEAQMTFIQIMELVIVALSEGWKEDHLQCTGLAVQCLSTMARIDYDLVLPFISRILPLLLQIPVPSDPHFAFLEILLSYHTKTRTVAAFVQNLLSAISGSNGYSKGPHERYQLFFSSPIMQPLFLDRLSKALQKFLTESQCPLTVELVFDALKNTWESFYCDSRVQEAEPAEGPRKKRKTSTVIEGHNLEDISVTYSLISRLASVVLSSIPIPSLSSDILNKVLHSLSDFRTGFIHHAISKSIKIMKKQTDADLWSTEVTLAATLRLLYALNVSRNLSLPVQYDKKVVKKMTELVANDRLLPELTLELYRTLLYNLSHENSLSHENIIEQLLQYLENTLTPANVRWSRHSHHLTKGEPGRAESALATIHMVIERWLPEIDRLASANQLERFLKIILSINLSPRSVWRQQMQPEQVLMEVLHSAQFWELRNIRSAFLTLLDQMTAPYDSVSSKQPKSSSMLNNVSIYRYLLFFPMEYFSWQLLNDLIKRCLAADAAIGRLPQTDDGEVIEALMVLRIFLKKAYSYSGSVSQEPSLESSEFLTHSLMSISENTDLPADFIKATLGLAEIHLSKLLKASKKNEPKALLEVLASFQPDLFNKALGIRALTLILLVGLLERDFPPDSLLDEVVAAIGKLHQEISSSSIPCIDTITEKGISQDDLRRCANLVSGWHNLLCLQKWLVPTGNTAPVLRMVGQKMTSSLMSCLKNADRSQNKELDELCVNTFAILLQELDSRPVAEHPQQLDIIVAVYISLSGVLNQSSRKKLDLNLNRTYRTMAVSDYAYTSSLIADSLLDLEHLAPAHLIQLVDLASILLREHPTHSLFHVQKFASHCINIFDRNPIFVQGPLDLRLQVLDLISQHCSDQQAALRSVDASAIWLLLSKYLAHSPVHDESTELAVFHKITTIVSSLIRLRRDLVAHALPQLGLILRQLILSTRACRPNLGGKQTALVMATQPRWISTTNPLGAEEAKSLGRLLESLNTKTTVRFLTSSSTGTQKAESLAKPFSKHAAYVLEAYIEAMNDPLCVLSSEVRKELQPGLFALCGMISEHSRDSLMVSSLDAGGKMILKALWKEYEKQRYVGKG